VLTGWSLTRGQAVEPKGNNSDCHMLFPRIFNLHRLRAHAGSFNSGRRKMKSDQSNILIKNIEVEIIRLWKDIISDSQKTTYILIMNEFRGCCIEISEISFQMKESYYAEYDGILKNTVNTILEIMKNNNTRSLYNICVKKNAKWNLSPGDMIGFGNIYLKGYHDVDEWKIKMLSFQLDILQRIEVFSENPFSMDPL
jgi:hypothetical protein